MTEQVQSQSPFKGSCLSHVASIASGFASALEGMSNPAQLELVAAQYLFQMIQAHLQALMPATPVTQPEETKAE